MQIVLKRTADLIPYERNPRDNDGAVDAVAASIREFGFKVPIIVDKDGVIVAGHTRLKAAKKLGMAEVPCIVADDLTPEQVKAFRLADNKTGELAEWDFGLLDEELAELGGIDMSLFGFDINAVTGNTDATEDAMFNIGILEGSKPGIIKMLDAYASNFLDIVVWNKAQSMPHGMESQRGMLSHRCELVFCFNQKGSRSFTHPQWAKGAGINRIDTGNASGNEYAKEHAATFPVEFAFEAVKNFSADSVLDLFGGTGTTMIAAEQLGRICYMMELDPHYCDVIIDRWEKFTGKKAVRIDA